MKRKGKGKDDDLLCHLDVKKLAYHCSRVAKENNRKIKDGIDVECATEMIVKTVMAKKIRRKSTTRKEAKLQ